jgi:hypothetical protein
MTQYPLPEFWPQFVASVVEQNNFLAPGALRKYQAGLLDKGTFSVISPFSGDCVSTSASANGMPGQLSYYFPNHTSFWLLTPAAQFKSAHPLVQAVTEHDMKRHYLHNRRRPPLKPATNQRL